MKEQVRHNVNMIVMVLLLCMAMPMSAQTISVESFGLIEGDLTANTEGSIELDQNGEKAALIKVVTTQTGFKFDCGSLGIVKIKQDTGEIWVYVPRGVRRITVQHDQYGVLRNYAFPIVIEGARTYEMKLVTTPAKVDARSSVIDRQTKKKRTDPVEVLSVSTVEYVDLGLSVDWATCNLGAYSPEQYGNYYAWAETEPRTGSSWNYDWNTTPFYLSGNSYKNVNWSKYTDSDGESVLDPADDAAAVALGSPWRMPTLDEIRELLTKCKWTWTTMNGNKVCKVVGPNGNSIFLPAAGWRSGTNFLGSTCGFCWSGSLNVGNPHKACYLTFNSDNHDWNSATRDCGLSIRPVRPNSKTYAQQMVRDTIPVGDTSGVQTDYVDLGLSVKWATCNLGASTPEQYGDYYAWGEITPRRNSSWKYTWNTTPYYKRGDSNKNNLKWKKYTDSDRKTVLDSADDVATVAWGSPWRMPTIYELKELMNKCTWVWISMNNTEGYKVVAPNGNSIFLPAAGYRNWASLDGAGNRGGYWSNVLGTINYPNCAVCLRINSGIDSEYCTPNCYVNVERYLGQSVRPVRP